MDWLSESDLCYNVSHLSPEDQLPPGFPTIDMGPQLKVVERTRTATMLCAASGNPDPDISWFKDFLPVNTTNNNGRIKQLRSGRLPLMKIWLQNRESSFFLPSIWSAPTVVSSVLSSSSSSHNLTSHLAFHFVGNGIVSTISCPLLSVRPGVCCLYVCLPLSSSVVMGCWDCYPSVFVGFCPNFCPHCSLLWLLIINYFAFLCWFPLHCIGAVFFFIHSLHFFCIFFYN